MKAELNNIRVSPKKVQLIAGMIRNMNANEALKMLQFTPKRGADVLYKVLKSAIANAENNFNQKPEDLTIARIEVGKGITFKRFRPVSRGRAHPLLKKTSNITLEVAVATKTVEKPTVKAKQETKKTAEAKVETKTKETAEKKEPKAKTEK